jgi:hypothetical protein
MSSRTRLALTAATLAASLAAYGLAFAQTTPPAPPPTMAPAPGAVTTPAPHGAGQNQRAQRFVSRFNAANTAHDGRLTLAQASAANMPMVVKHFAEIDTAHNGYITLADVQAYRQIMRAQQRAAAGQHVSRQPTPAAPGLDTN